MVFLPNPPVKDAAGGEADKSLHYAQKIILGISIICRLVPVLQRGGYFFRMPFYPVISSGGF
jgi:hypothetical protein